MVVSIIHQKNWQKLKGVKSNMKILFSLIITIVLLSGCVYSTDEVINKQKRVEDQSVSLKIETFLDTNIPDLSLSYREVIDQFLLNGIDIYLYGGAIRDLIQGEKPNDLDFIFFGDLELIKTVLTDCGWPYTVKQIKMGTLITIGDPKGKHFMQGMSDQDAQIYDVNALEFGCNSIFYDCRLRNFLPQSKLYIIEVMERKIEPTSRDWKTWLYCNKRRHLKIWRTWKMMGRGYQASLEYCQFIRSEILNMRYPELDLFQEDLLRYLSREYEEFDVIAEAASKIMGDEWSRSNVYSLRDQAAIITK